ncbi:MAG: bifunctional diguanylate cyclase/phosphodiesterase [Xanthomonadales bacterium]|nr:bifunctional diguanylate cyclase/phosphodiesterase [Xanthomonadales bacterium]
MSRAALTPPRYRAAVRAAPFVTVALAWLVAALALWRDARTDVDALQGSAERERAAQLRAKARELEQSFGAVYQALRMLSLMPSLRRAAPEPGEQADDATFAVPEDTRDAIRSALDLLAFEQPVTALVLAGATHDYSKGLQQIDVWPAGDTRAVGRVPPDRSHMTGGAAVVGGEAAFYLAQQLAVLDREAERPAPSEAPRASSALLSPELKVHERAAGVPGAGETLGLLYTVPVHDSQNGRLIAALSAVVDADTIEARLLDWPMLPRTDDDWASLRSQGVALQTRPWAFVLENRALGVRIFDRRMPLVDAWLDGRIELDVALRERVDVRSDGTWQLHWLAPVGYLHDIGAARWRAMWLAQAACLALATMLIGLLRIVLGLHAQASHLLQEQAGQDALTGLLSRIGFLQQLDDAFVHGDEASIKRGVLVVGIDGLRTVNETYGSTAGDQLIRRIAQRISLAIGAEAEVSARATSRLFAGRLSGSEIAIAYIDVARLGVLTRLADQLIKSLGAHVEHQQSVLRAEPVIGLALCPEHALDAEGLMRRATEALEAARRAAGPRWRAFDAQLEAATRRRQQLLGDLRTAAQSGALTLSYLPMLDMDRRRITTIEALLRWEHPELGNVAPAEFIPLLEQSGMMLGVSDWAIEQTCRHWAALRMRGHEGLCVAFNLTASQLLQPMLRSRLQSLLESHGLLAEQMTFEVRESALRAWQSEVGERLDELRRFGSRIVLDEFGVGSHDIQHLRQLPMQAIKLDHRLLRASEGGRSEDVLHALIRLARSLGSEVQVCGVETREALALVRNAGCSLVQGFLLSRPLDARTLEAFLNAFDAESWMHEQGIHP